MRLRLPLILAAALAAGCQSDPPQVATASEVSGSVTGPDGKPLGDVRVVFTPAGRGLMQGGGAVSADGKFSTKLVPGSYMYSFEALPNKDGAYKAVPEKYRTPDTPQTIEVAAGQPVALKVAK